MRTLLATLLVLSLSACGFHLRGSQGLMVDIDSAYVSSVEAYSDLMREMESTLKAQGVAVTSESNAEYKIAFLAEGLARRPVSTTGSGSVAEYELQLYTVVQILDSNNQVVLPETRLVTDRIYSFDTSSLVGSSEEQDVLTEEMQRDLCAQIIRRLGATLRSREGNET